MQSALSIPGTYDIVSMILIPIMMISILPVWVGIIMSFCV